MELKKLIYKRSFIIIRCLFLLVSIQITAQKSTSDNALKQAKEIKNAFENDSSNFCVIPAPSFEVTNSGEIEKLANISGSKVNIDNREGTVNNITYIYQFNIQANKQLYSPERTEEYHLKEFENIIGAKVDSISKQIARAYSEKIELWEYRIEQLEQKLKGITDPVIKKQGVEIIKKYKKNVKAAQCLGNDYFDKAVIEVDQEGNNNYLFDTEKINDPNYIVIKEKKEGFSVVKKFNLYGYFSSSDKYEDIEFKYTQASSFKYGNAYTTDINNHYIINKFGEEILSYKKTIIDSIQIISNSRFILYIKKNSHSYNDKHVLIDRNGKLIVSGYEIKPISYNNVLYVSEYVPYEEEKESDYLSSWVINNKHKYGLIDYFSDLNGKKINRYINCKKDLFFCDKKCKKPNITQVIIEPNRERGLFVGRLYHHGNNYYLIVKDLKKNRTTSCEILDGHRYYSLIKFYEKDSYQMDIVGFHENRYWYQCSPPIFIYPNKTINSYNDSLKIKDFRKNSSFKIDSENLIEIAQTKNLGVYDILNSKQLGSNFNKLKSIISEEKCIIFANNIFTVSGKIATKQLGYGVMNYNDLKIVPPIFKQITYSSELKIFEVISFDKKKFKINIDGTCVGDCKDYRKIRRNFFSFTSSISE